MRRRASLFAVRCSACSRRRAMRHRSRARRRRSGRSALAQPSRCRTPSRQPSAAARDCGNRHLSRHGARWPMQTPGFRSNNAGMTPPGLLVSQDCAPATGRWRRSSKRAGLSLRRRRDRPRARSISGHGMATLEPEQITPVAARDIDRLLGEGQAEACVRRRAMAGLCSRHRRGRHMALFRLRARVRPRRPCRCAAGRLGRPARDRTRGRARGSNPAPALIASLRWPRIFTLFASHLQRFRARIAAITSQRCRMSARSCISRSSSLWPVRFLVRAQEMGHGSLPEYARASCHRHADGPFRSARAFCGIRQLRSGKELT